MFNGRARLAQAHRALTFAARSHKEPPWGCVRRRLWIAWPGCPLQPAVLPLPRDGRWRSRRALAADRRGAWWLAAMYAALGTGVLTKGLVPLVVAGIPLAVITLRDEGWRGFGRLRPALGVAVLAAIVLPWHVLAAFRHPGFAWDYV